MRRFVVAALALLAVCATGLAQPGPSETDIADAYVYLVGRALVIRQEHSDLAEPGIDYNVVKYNPTGPAELAAPDLDAVSAEAWVAVDDTHSALLRVPTIEGRYYAVQVCDEWGEVITNINARNYSGGRYGRFAFIAPDSTSGLPPFTRRIKLHSHKAKMLVRLELKGDPEGAARLLREFQLRPLGQPEVEPAVPMPAFDNESLLGAEIFDNVEAVLDSAPDLSAVATEMQQKVRAVAEHVARGPEERAAVDELIREKVVPQFLDYAATKTGICRNNWVASLRVGAYGEDYRLRAAANLVDIWANVPEEVIHFEATRDANGDPLDGSRDYVIHFPKAQRPETVVDAYWSMTLGDLPQGRVVPNPLNRFHLNSYSTLKPEADGSLRIHIGHRLKEGVPESNWLPSPEGKPSSLTFTTCVPKDVVKRGEWFPPAVTPVPNGG